MHYTDVFHKFSRPKKVRRIVYNSSCTLENALFYKQKGNIDKSIQICESIVAGAENGTDQKIALYELAILYCQLGLHHKASIYLSRIGFKYKLSGEVFAPLYLEHGFDTNNNSLVHVYDNALPLPFLERLKYVFGSNSDYWTGTFSLICALLLT